MATGKRKAHIFDPDYQQERPGPARLYGRFLCGRYPDGRDAGRETCQSCHWHWERRVEAATAATELLASMGDAYSIQLKGMLERGEVAPATNKEG